MASSLGRTWARMVLFPRCFRQCSFWEKFMRIVKSVISWLNTHLHLLYFLIHSMEQSPSWEANRFSTSIEIPPHFMEPEGSLPHSQCPPPFPVLSHIDPAHAPTSHLLLSSLLLSSHLRQGLLSSLFPSGFPTKTLYAPVLFPIHDTCPTNLILLDFITRILLGEKYLPLSSSLCSFLYSPATYVYYNIEK